MARIVSGPYVAGQVTSKETGAPLGGGTVTVNATVYSDPELTSGTTSLTVDGTGRFSFYASPGNYTFTASNSTAKPIEPVEILGQELGTNLAGGGSVSDATAGAKGIIQLAGDLGGSAASPTVPGLAGKQASDADLTAIAALDSSTAGAIASDGAGWIKKTYAQVKSALSIASGDVSGLGTAATANTGTTSGTLPLLSTGGVLPIARLATGTPDGTKFVRDDGTLVTPTAGNVPYVLTYDTTGVVDAGAVLQTAVDAGHRLIMIPEGVFYANTPVFIDHQDGNASTRIVADGVVFKAGTGLPTSAEFDAYCTANSRATGCKFFLFPSTARAGLSGGVVTGTGHDVAGTGTYPTTRNGVSPHLIVDGGTFDASNITASNAGFVFGNVGGASELRSVHMESARCLLSWTGYVDANKMINCSGWASTSFTATNDAALFYQIAAGDGVFIQGCKTDNYIFTARMNSCNGALIDATVGGGYEFTICHGIVIIGNHTEQASNISVAPRIIYKITDSDVTVIGSFDYMNDNQVASQGAFYINDTGTEGKHSKVEIVAYNARHWVSVSDPVGGPAIYINKMGNPTRIRVRSSGMTISASGGLSTAYGRMGLQIDGNATNEPSLAAALVAGRDVIASGDFEIVKYGTAAISAGQDQAIPIVVTAIGPMADARVTRVHTTPTFYDAETNVGTGTLTNAQSYAYAAAVCNTLPDGTIQYGAATAESATTAAATGAIGKEIYMPTAGHGATLVVWRKTGTGVLATPDRYVVIPVNSATTRLLDTGANINKLPWITSSVPVPNSVAATNHTLQNLYVGTGTVGLPDQTSNSGKYLTTNGTTASWGTVSATAADAPAAVLMADDFLDGSLTAGQIGTHGWNKANGTLTQLAGVTNHPGIIQIGSTTTANTISQIYLATATSGVNPIFPTDLWDVTFWVRTSSNDSDTKLRIGVMANGTADGTSTGAWIEKLFADTNWFTVSRNNAGTQTRTDSGFAVPSTSTWSKLRVRRIDASTVGFTVDANTESTVATNLPDTPAVQPIVQITGQTTAAKTIDVDRILVSMSGLTR